MNHKTEKNAIIERHAAELAAFEREYKMAQGGAVAGHTPGPWTVKGTFRFIEVVDATGLPVGSVMGKTARRQTANARLIAAAPEMLEALILGRDALANWSDYTTLAEMDAAIATAKGGES